MTQRRERGEALALVLKALREHPRGLSAREVAAETGIDQMLCGVLLGGYRSTGHVESTGRRPFIRWYIAGKAPSAQPPQLVTPRSVVVPRLSGVTPQFAIGISRVMATSHCIVAPDDFSEGAFMRDWLTRTSSSSAA